MHRLTPRFILQQAEEGNHRGEFAALCLFADISGFTPLTLALMEHGTEGAEVLAAVLDAVFEPLIETVYAHGGFIAGFAGDAFKALFPMDGLHACDHAVAAAAEIRRLLTTSPTRKTRFGEFSFSGKVCLAAGDVSWEIWSGPPEPTGTASRQAAYLFGGPGIQAAMGLDPLAEQGDLLAAEQVIAGLSRSRVSGRSGQGGLLIDKVIDPVQPKDRLRPAPPAEEMPAAAARFYPEALLTTTVPGEFRRVTTVFLNFEQPINGDGAASFQADLFALLSRYGGFLCRVGQIGGKDNGQTLLLFWGAPRSAERDSARALGFILDLQAISPVRIRAGVTTQLAFAGFVGSEQREEYTCHSSYVNLAARQMVAAGWGEVWVDETTATRTRGFDLPRRGEQRFKGFSAPLPIYRLMGRVDDVRRAFYAGRLIGRTTEIERLQRPLARLRRGKFGGFVLVDGEAGIGKSRLVHEALDLDVSHFTPRSGRGNAYAVTLLQTDEILRGPLNPIRYGLRTLFRQHETAGAAEARARFDGAMDALIEATPDPALAEELIRVRSFLAALVDVYWQDSRYARVEPELRYENTLRAIKTLICALSLQQPQVLLLEDIHWLDVETQELIQLLMRDVERYPFLLIATRRTGAADEQALEEMLAPLVDQRITLRALDSDAIRAIGADLLGGPPAPALTTDLASRSDGNPFFAEQIIRYLQEEDLLVEEADGWQLRGGQQHAVAARLTALTGDVRSILTARLDRLSADLKETVQRAAVLGREFDTRVLRQISGTETADTAFDQQLAAGASAGIWSAIEASRYLFRHGLLRDAAYDMQLRARLRHTHAAAADAVKRLFAAQLAPRYADLVYHYNRAEREDDERRYAELAGGHAAQQFANEDAVRFLSRALELTPDDHQRARLGLYKARAEVWNTTGNRESQLSDLTQITALAEAVEEPDLLADAYLLQANYARVISSYEEAEAWIERAVSFAGRAELPTLLARSYNCWGQIRWRQGDYPRARRLLAQALDHAHVESANEEMADISYQLGLVDYYEAKYDHALAHLRDAQKQYIELGLQKGNALCLSMFGAIHYQTGDYSLSQESYEESLAIANDLGWRHTSALLYGLVGTNLLDLGDFAGSEAFHRRALTACQELDDTEGIAVSMDALGLIAAFQGRPAAAIQHYDDAISLQRQIGDRRGLGYTLTHAGHAYLAQDNPEAALAAFGEAADLRRELGDDAACMDSLAGLAFSKFRLGRAADAVSLCNEILSWLQANDLSGVEYPVQVYLICWRVLNQSTELAGDAGPRALDVLAEGHRLLTARAVRINDPELRAAFTRMIPFNAELAAAWDAYGRQRQE